MEKDITVNNFLNKLKMEMDLNNNGDHFKKIDFNLVVTLLERNGYHTPYYNENYEFEISDASEFYNKDFNKNKNYKIYYYDNDDEILVRIIERSCEVNIYICIKNDHNDLLNCKINYLHFTKNDFIKIFNLINELTETKGLNIIKHTIIIRDTHKLVFDNIEDLKNSTYNFRNLANMN